MVTTLKTLHDLFAKCRSLVGTLSQSFPHLGNLHHEFCQIFQIEITSSLQVVNLRLTFDAYFAEAFRRYEGLAQARLRPGEDLEMEEPDEQANMFANDFDYGRVLYGGSEERVLPEYKEYLD